MLINVSEAKANLSSLINRAYQGEEITIAKHNMPMVDLVVHKPKKQGNRKFGILEGAIFEVDGYDLLAEDKDIIEMFENSEIFPEE